QPRPVQHLGRGSGLGVDGAERGSAVAHLDDLHPLGPLLDAAAQLLDLELQVHEAVEDELELLAGDVTARGRDPDREPASPLADVPRDVARPDFAFGGEHDHRFDEVAQLAHVAGPVGVHQDLERLRGDAVELAVVGGRELRDEAPHQERDVRPPLAQRRQIDVEDVEAVEEVVPEAAQGDLLLQGLVGRGDDAHVHLDRLRAADAEEGTVLEHTQQLHLRRRGQDRKSTRLNSSHVSISYAVFCLKKKKTTIAIDSASDNVALFNGIAQTVHDTLHNSCPFVLADGNSATVSRHYISVLTLCPVNKF